MYLLTAAQVNSVLSNSSQQQQGMVSTGVGDVSRYATPLRLVKTRCEELMEVRTLSRVTTLDCFEVSGRSIRQHILRLSNALLTQDPADFLITDADESPLDLAAEVDREKGEVHLVLRPGKYRVTYTSGLTVDADDVFENVPDWLQSIAISAMGLQYRLTTMAAATPANVSYGDLLPEVRRELMARVNKRFQRSRVDATLPYMSTSNG